MSSAPKKLFLLGIILLLIFPAVTLGADETKPAPETPRPTTVTHILGDQAFLISLGGLFPLFFVRLADGATEATNLYIGAKASVEYMNYLSQSFAFAVELGGGFNFSPNFNPFWLLPITAKICAMLPIGPCQLFFNLGLGVIFESFVGYSHMDIFARPQVAFYIPVDPTIDLGLTVGYWLIPQFAAIGSTQDPAQNRLGNFLDASFSLIYHF